MPPSKTIALLRHILSDLLRNANARCGRAAPGITWPGYGAHLNIESRSDRDTDDHVESATAQLAGACETDAAIRDQDGLHSRFACQLKGDGYVPGANGRSKPGRIVDTA